MLSPNLPAAGAVISPAVQALDRAEGERRAALTPIDIIPADIDARAAASVEAQVNAFAAAYIRRPDKIAELLYGTFATMDGRDLVGVLVEVREKVRRVREVGHSGHWTYSYTRLESLVAAEHALVAMIAARAAA